MFFVNFSFHVLWNFSVMRENHTKFDPTFSGWWRLASSSHINDGMMEPKKFKRRKPGSWAWSRFQYPPLHCLT
jgi:hypothetical protein